MEYLKTQGDTPQWHPTLRAKAEKKDEEESEDTAKEIEQEEEAAEENSFDLEEQQKQTYESFANRLPNVKKERNKRLYRRLTLIISVFLVAILVVLYIVSPFSKLGDIKVSNNEHVDGKQIITSSKLKKGMNLWGQFFDREIYEKNVKRKFPRIKKAEISLSGINSFNIKVEEYQVVATESENGRYYPVLENGLIISEPLDGPDSSKPVFQNFENQEALIKKLIISYEKLPEEIKNNISEIKYEPSASNKELVTLNMKDTNRVIVNVSQLDEKMKYYQQVAGQMTEPGVIDMEVGIFSYPFKKESSEENIEEDSEASAESL